MLPSQSQIATIIRQSDGFYTESGQGPFASRQVAIAAAVPAQVWAKGHRHGLLAAAIRAELCQQGKWS